MSKAKKKIKYAIIQHTSLEHLCRECNAVLESGYTPIGGISTVVDVRNQNVITYTQAFTYEPKENS